MEHLAVGDTAPDFELTDFHGVSYHLSRLTRDQNVLLVFNIGFS